LTLIKFILALTQAWLYTATSELLFVDRWVQRYIFFIYCANDKPQLQAWQHKRTVTKAKVNNTWHTTS